MDVPMSSRPIQYFDDHGNRLIVCVRGWRAIAELLGVSRFQAMRWAQLKRDPLPVQWEYPDSRPAVYADPQAIRDWMARRGLR